MIRLLWYNVVTVDLNGDMLAAGTRTLRGGRVVSMVGPVIGVGQLAVVLARVV